MSQHQVVLRRVATSAAVRLGTGWRACTARLTTSCLTCCGRCGCPNVERDWKGKKRAAVMEEQSQRSQALDGTRGIGGARGEDVLVAGWVRARWGQVGPGGGSTRVRGPLAPAYLSSRVPVHPDNRSGVQSQPYRAPHRCPI